MDNHEEHWAAAMRAARNGCREAYVRLLTELSTSLRTWAYAELRRLGIEPCEAEDVVQETLLAIHTKRDTWDESRPFLPWVRAIVRYKAVDFARRRRGTRVPLDSVAEMLAAAPQQPGAAHHVQQCLNALPPRQREVVQALAINGETVSDAAARLRISREAVYVAFHRGLAALAAEVSE